MVVGQHALVDREESARLEMRRSEDAAIAAMRQHRVVEIVFARHDRKTRWTATQQLERLREITRGILDADDVGSLGKFEERVIREIAPVR